MQRFFLPPEATREDRLVLSDREAHHALNVVRLRPGESVAVLNGAGERLWCHVAELGRREVILQVTRRESLPVPAWDVTLIQAIPKGKAFDTILQKATELGAARIIPLISHRVVSQIDPDRAESKVAHWRAIAIESIKQCGSPRLPAIDDPIALPTLLSRLAASAPAGLQLVASLRPDARPPREVIDPVVQPTLGTPAHTPREAQIWVGPEGDFTDEELDAIQGSGAIPISLGPLVLRADTAAITCLAMLNYAGQYQASRA